MLKPRALTSATCRNRRERACRHSRRREWPRALRCLVASARSKVSTRQRSLGCACCARPIDMAYQSGELRTGKADDVFRDGVAREGGKERGEQGVGGADQMRRGRENGARFGRILVGFGNGKGRSHSCSVAHGLLLRSPRLPAPRGASRVSGPRSITPSGYKGSMR